MPCYFLIVSISFHVNVRDAAQAVIHAVVEQIFFGSTRELQGVHLHLPRSVEATLRKQNRVGKQDQDKGILHRHSSVDAKFRLTGGKALAILRARHFPWCKPAYRSVSLLYDSVFPEYLAR